MNPKSKEAVAERSRFHGEAVSRFRRLKRSGTASAYELERAEIDVVSGLSRMEAMGDPLPGDAPTPPLPMSVALALTPPPLVSPSAAAGTPPQPEPEPDPIEGIVARIMKA